MDSSTQSTEAPVIVVGSGGSGTRLVARILIDSGIHMGADLNESLDDLLFTFLFKRPTRFDRNPLTSNRTVERLVCLHEKISRGADRLTIGDRVQLAGAAYDHAVRRRFYDRAWITERMRQIRQRAQRPPAPWGWKEPHAAYFLDALSGVYPQARLILVTRNGLDMAYTRTDQQLRHWPRSFQLDGDDTCPLNLWTYWYRYNRYLMGRGRALFGDRFLCVRHEDLCQSPRVSIDQMVDFASASACQATDAVYALPAIPASHGRHLKENQDWITPEVRAKTAELGYPDAADGNGSE